MIGWGFSFVDRTVAAAQWSPLISGLAFFALLSAANGLFSLPFELYSIFVLEEKHGFNRQTLSGFLVDKLKGLVIGAVVGAALLSLVLVLMDKGGDYWWLYAFVGVSAIQLLMVWIYPVVIMPWFNRFTTVPEDLAADVAALAGSVRFPLKSVFSMDGSKRSAHANAFIIGLVGARKIVLFDTLIEKISRSQLLAVLAHELGHFKLKHLSKRIVLIVISLAGMFYGISVLKNGAEIYPAFGFSRPTDAAAIVIFSLIISEIAAPFGWVLRYLSRKDERAADRFAVEAVKNGRDLSEALIALNKQNLSSPGSHPLYRGYYNSHPALKERLAAIRVRAAQLGLEQVD
jgi:STE24 endopeptidase